MTRRKGAPAAPERYPTLASFYAADPRRMASRELDVGLWWRQSEDGPLHRAAWVLDTGDLYLVRLGSGAGGGGTVELLARVVSRAQLEEALGGWREQCGAPASLGWLRERAARLRARMRLGSAAPVRAIAPRRGGTITV